MSLFSKRIFWYFKLLHTRALTFWIFGIEIFTFILPLSELALILFSENDFTPLVVAAVKYAAWRRTLGAQICLASRRFRFHTIIGEDDDEMLFFMARQNAFFTGVSPPLYLLFLLLLFDGLLSFPLFFINISFSLYSFIVLENISLFIGCYYNARFWSAFWSLSILLCWYGALAALQRVIYEIFLQVILISK